MISALAGGLGAGRRSKDRSASTMALAIVLAILSIALPAAAFNPPPLEGHVVDAAHALSPTDIRYLDDKLETIRQNTGFAIVAFLPDSLQGENIDDVAYQVFNTWGIGQKGRDNGVLLVIALAERKVRIETGLGVGGALTDLQSNDIIRDVIRPLLATGKVREAIDQGTMAIAEALVRGTPSSDTSRPPPRAPPSPIVVGLGAGGLLLIILLAIVSPRFRSALVRILALLWLFGGRGGGGGDGGSGFTGGGGRSRGGGSSDEF